MFKDLVSAVTVSVQSDSGIPKSKWPVLVAITDYILEKDEYNNRKIKL